ncbi:glutamine--fructose-6-phosphate transaminase [Balneicella halophila]|uniref:Glutamine--fructose-6-phosphate aminotransferase [isomerizing] n=1 Tax=Balneicella halophila TaxID=1537566 RepID=A0A7L4UNR3_BALHA|nr:glutamine--fructose-6-phosphate transaminase (isomerizing) [Balneicella halophila]PVX50741.1 glutamine--fructose-6-phosphate transaminase [Balneicella halophila]
MCGIVGYIGNRKAYPILIEGLRRLEYRGYDSAGIALLADNELEVYKQVGKVADLEVVVPDTEHRQTLGVAHTRWATHGEATTDNAHPHYSFSKDIAVVHNGIIENYMMIKRRLLDAGYKFRSETDTEVIVNLIESERKQGKVSLELAVNKALQQVHGAYALAVLSKSEPEKMIVARKGSPLAIGLGVENKEFFVASDAIPIVEYTQDLIYLNDNEVAVLERGKKVEVKDIYGKVKNYKIKHIDLDMNMVTKGEYEHFMLKEIFEQPNTIANTIFSHLSDNDDRIYFEGLEELKKQLSKARRIIIVACGTSWHSGLIGEYLIEELARVPVEVEYASEFRYRNPIVREDDIVLAISQSGETADTLAALRYSKEQGATTFAVCNVYGSSMARECDFTAYTYAGVEIGVASTKAFTAQVAVLTMLAIAMGVENNILDDNRAVALITELRHIPELVEKTLQTDKAIEKIAKEFLDVNSFLYLGRGINFPIALEGALKLKEISYIHAEGYPAAEMKHGPIAMIDESLPTLIVGTNEAFYEKIVSNAQEVKARKGTIVAVVNEGDTELAAMADYVLTVPKVDELLQPILVAIPLHLFSYHIAVMKGCNVDQPRNLAKSVTVE